VLRTLPPSLRGIIEEVPPSLRGARGEAKPLTEETKRK